MAWEWIGLGAPLAAAAGAAINEVARRGKRDEERLEFARKGLAAARDDLQDEVMIEAYKRELERVLVSGVRVSRRARELLALVIGSCVLIACGINLLKVGSDRLSEGTETLPDTFTAWGWVAFGSALMLAGVGMMIFAQSAVDRPRRSGSREEVERDLRGRGGPPTP